VTAPPQNRRCVRCDADLTVPPHVKLCWHGVPGAYLTGESDTNQKGDLCDPCHEEWKKEREAGRLDTEITSCSNQLKNPLGRGTVRCPRPSGHEGECW